MNQKKLVKSHNRAINSLRRLARESKDGKVKVDDMLPHLANLLYLDIRDIQLPNRNIIDN